ncbi:uncharacterized protein FIBRA_06856 [Fibroporia radiculosa]|uniref:Mediator of RNA polymerase II transcription subunit 19 n=1 Tax=Fibroporia radiculosa TaxID=599839 RepID=J4GTQ4_9APHY|nr:uncharacterized protein FIBRA_06856 [Fibroporia radiculosa]CCM04670.1 predicted protein [Fibroporia radiculosa]
MEVDDNQHPASYSLQPTNALAGPSSQPELPPIYLLPPGTAQPRPLLTSTQDLISRFQLLPAYDKYVRPYALPVGQQPPTAGTLDKGKGKEKELSLPPNATPGAAQEGEDEEGKGEKKSKNTYRQLIKGIPGKHSMKKDTYLLDMIQVPPKQQIAITPFDLRTQRDAFSVSLEGLKSWNINTLVAESPQAREDRKKRKELKKLAKAQAQVPLTLASGGVPDSSASSILTSAQATTTATTRSGTPKPGGNSSRSSAIPNPSNPRGRTPVGIGTPQSIPTPGPTTTSSVTSGPSPAIATASMPVRVAQVGPVLPVQAGPDPNVPPRGVKREREHSIDRAQVQAGVNGSGAGAVGTHSQSAHSNGNVVVQGKSAAIVGAKAGSAGVRPRPLKRPRMDIQGQPLPVQQPTPHA